MAKRAGQPSPIGGAPKVAFRAILESNGKTATGIVIPDEVVATLGHGQRPPVRVTIADHTYRSTVAVMGGRHLIGVSAENRAAAGVAAGDEVDVVLELDLEPRELVVPADFQTALDRSPEARAFFDGLAYSVRQWHVLSIEGAKTPETRQRRIDKSISMLSGRRAR